MNNGQYQGINGLGQQPYGNNQQPYGNNQQPYGNNQQPYGNNQQPYYVVQQDTKVKKHKKKKKHRFLKFMLFCIIVYLLYKLSCSLLWQYAEKQMQKFVVDYPFTFYDEDNSLWYVTNNIDVPNTYEFDNKEYKVEWSTNNKAITVTNEDNISTVNIKRPSDSTVDIVLTETYKVLWGKATREYTLSIIPTSYLSEVDVANIEDIESGEYQRDIQAVFDENNNLKYIMGNFKDTYVNSKEDAIIVMEAYKNQFTNQDIQLEFYDIMQIGIYKTYKFKVYRQGIESSTESASLTVESSSNKLNKIAIDIDEDYQGSNINTSDVLTEQQIEDYVIQYIQNLKENTYTTDEYMIINRGQQLSNNKVIYVEDILLMDGDSYNLKLDAMTGEVLECTTLYESSQWRDLEEDIECSGTTEEGANIKFDATHLRNDGIFFWGEKDYRILKDRNRNIHAYYNEGWWGLFLEAQKAANKKDPNFIEQVADVFVMLAGMGDYYIENLIRAEIKSESTAFEDSVSAQAYHNMQIVYDWYKDNLGIISYNGKGKEITIRTNVNLANDNAAWDSGTKTFMINPSERLKYSVGLYLEVLGHEYTHAVFAYAGVDLSDGTEDIPGLSEAYGDIMGIIIAQKEDWLVGDTQLADGTPKTMRDLKNINREGLLYDLKYPETYHGEYWTGEEHNICAMIGHVACEMQQHGGFSWDDLANIWYNSLGLCYDSSSTYVTCRKYVIKTAEDLGYSDEQVDFIAKAFDDREIFDPSYEFKTSQSDNTEDTASDGSTTKKAKDNSIAGDPIYDDTSRHRFLVAYSVIGSVLGKSEVIIYEEADTMTKEEQEQVGNRISEMFAKEGITDIEDKAIKVHYEQVNSFKMNILEKFCSNSLSQIKSATYESIGMNTSDSEFEEAKGWLEYIFDLCFHWSVTNRTAYEFYDQLGIIE